jgi:hypothetical protein
MGFMGFIARIVLGVAERLPTTFPLSANGTTDAR